MIRHKHKEQQYQLHEHGSSVEICMPCSTRLDTRMGCEVPCTTEPPTQHHPQTTTHHPLSMCGTHE